MENKVPDYAAEFAGEILMLRCGRGRECLECRDGRGWTGVVRRPDGSKFLQRCRSAVYGSSPYAKMSERMDALIEAVAAQGRVLAGEIAKTRRRTLFGAAEFIWQSLRKKRQ